MEELTKGCPRCGKSSKNSGNKAGRCSSCLKKLSANKKKPGHYLEEHRIADDAIKRQKGGTETSSKKSKNLGSRKSLISQVRSAYKKHGKGTRLSADRRKNNEGYGKSNTRLVPKGLNVGRHHVDPKKLKNWQEKVKKHDLSYDQLLTLLRVRAQENHNEELMKTLMEMRTEDLAYLIDNNKVEDSASNIEDDSRFQYSTNSAGKAYDYDSVKPFYEVDMKVLKIRKNGNISESKSEETNTDELFIKE